MGQGIVSPQLPHFLKASTQLAIDSGLSATLMYLGIFLASFLFGQMADRGRCHRLLAYGLFGYSLTLLGFARLASAPEHFGVAYIFTLRFLEGIALSAIYVAADFVLGRLSVESERGRWLSYYGVALSAGLLLGPLAILFWPESATTSKSAISTGPLFLLIAMVLLVGVFSVGIKALRISSVEQKGSAKSALATTPLYIGAGYGALEASLVALLPVIGLTLLQIQPEKILVVLILTAALSSIFWGELTDKIGPVRSVFLIVLVLTLGSALLLFMHAVEPRLFAYSMAVLFGIVAGGLYPTAFAWLLRELPAAHYGFASGAFTRAYGLGSLAGPALAGLMTAAYGTHGLLGFTGLLGFSSLVLMWRQILP